MRLFGQIVAIAWISIFLIPAIYEVWKEDEKKGFGFWACTIFMVFVLFAGMSQLD